MATNFTHSLFGGKINTLSGTLGLRLARHDLSSTNLANMDTPGFRANHIRFEEVLAQHMNLDPSELKPVKTNAAHLQTSDPGKMFEKAGNAIKRSPYGWDENDDDILDIDKEMTLLTKNQLIYNATVQMLQKSFEGLKSAMADTNGG